MTNLRVGAAEVEITPSAGGWMTGYILRNGPATGVHDPLYARALVFDDGANRAAIIVCDLLALDRQFVGAVREAIANATGVPPQNTLVATTHTHSGPATIFLQDCGRADEAWLSELHGRLVDLVRQAFGSLRPARTAAGSGRVTAGVENRRCPGGQTDPELGVWYAQDEGGAPIGMLVNYACHPTILNHENRLFSADYPGYAAARLHDLTGAVALFATGAAGNIGPVPESRASYDPIAASRSASGTGPDASSAFRRAEALGTAVADEAMRVLEALESDTGSSICGARAIIHLPMMEPPSPEFLEQFMAENMLAMEDAQSSLELARARVHRAMVGWAESTLGAIRAGQLGRTVPAEAQVVRLGSAVFVGIPGEPFVEIGRAIKARAPDRQVFIFGYANDDIGYIPAREAYAHGGYEIDEAYKYYGYPAVLAPEAGELFVESVLELMSGCLA